MRNLSRKLTGGLFNYNGDRDFVDGKGKLEITLDTLHGNIQEIQSLRLILADNESTDGSSSILFNCPFGEKHVFERMVDGRGWFPTTRNNFENLRRALSMTETPYYWNIENDSFFFNGAEVLEDAVKVLEENPDISIVHLRRWTPMDCRDKPGAPQNHCRVEGVRYVDGNVFYVLEKTDEEAVWVDVGSGLPEDFVPQEGHDFKSLSLGNESGCVRKTEKGWERLIEDHYNTYTTHGYVVRVEDFRKLLEKHKPLSEKETSIAFKKEFRAARLKKDLFLSFGWNTRVSPSPEETKRMFAWVREHNHSSVLDYGSYKGLDVDTSQSVEDREKFFQN